MAVISPSRRKGRDRSDLSVLSSCISHLSDSDGGDFNLTWPLGAPLARVAGRRGLPAHHKRRGVVFPALQIYTFPKPPYGYIEKKCQNGFVVRARSRVFQLQERFPYLAVPRRLPEACDGEGFRFVVAHGDEGSGELGRKKPRQRSHPEGRRRGSYCKRRARGGFRGEGRKGRDGALKPARTARESS